MQYLDTVSKEEIPNDVKHGSGVETLGLARIPETLILNKLLHKPRV
jgi:hypothetical protein